MMMNRRKKALCSIILSASVLLVAGCSNDEDLNQYIHKIKSRPARKIDPIPEFKPLPKYEYPEKMVRRNPFKVFQTKSKFDVAAPDKNRKKQPLEAFPLDSLKFVGLLERDHAVWALIQQPNGSISRIQSGEYMGQNYGRVLKITQDSIRLEETVKMAGKWEKKITNIQLNGKN